MSDVTPNVLDPTSIQNSIKSLNAIITKSKSAAAECQNQLKQAEARLTFTDALLKAIKLDETLVQARTEKEQNTDKAKGPWEAARQKLEAAKTKFASVQPLTPEAVENLQKELEAKTVTLTEKQAAATTAAEEHRKATEKKTKADGELATATADRNAAEGKYTKSKQSLEQGPTPAQKTEAEQAERLLKEAQAEFDKAEAEHTVALRKAEQAYTEKELQVRREQLDIIESAEDKSPSSAPKAG